MLSHEKVVCAEHDRVIRQCRCMEGARNVKRVACPGSKECPGAREG